MSCEIRTGMDRMEILAWGLCCLELLVYTLALGISLASLMACDGGMISGGQMAVLMALSAFCAGTMAAVRRGLII